MAQDSKAEPLVVRGQVLDPDGKPAAGAEVLLSVPGQRLDREVSRLGATGPDGRFEVSIPRASLVPKGGSVQDGPWRSPAIAAASPGRGPDWSLIDPAKPVEAITLKLRRDDVPIEGRVISLEGRPIPNLSVRIASIFEVPPATMNKLRDGNGKNPAVWEDLFNAFDPGREGRFPVRADRRRRPVPRERASDGIGWPT